MARAIWVACWMSPIAPVEMSSETISSAIRPAIVTAMMSSNSLRLRFNTSSFGRYIVEPKAWPRGMIVTLCSGCVCFSITLTSAWPASCQAVNFLSSSVMAMLRRSRPQRTLSRASSNSTMPTARRPVRAASKAASFNKLASSAPE